MESEALNEVPEAPRVWTMEQEASLLAWVSVSLAVQSGFSPSVSSFLVKICFLSPKQNFLFLFYLCSLRSPQESRT